MKTTKVCCQGCGADLEVDESIRFVTCNYCQSRLEIVHDETVTHSRLLEKIERKTDEISEDLKVIRLQNELEQLDREWAMQSASMMVTDKNGSKSVPSATGSVVGGVIMTMIGIFWMVATSSMGAPGFFPLFGLIFIAVAVIGMVTGATKSQAYETARDTMNLRRSQLLKKLEEARRG
jgi:hypothetical protein